MAEIIYKLYDHSNGVNLLGDFMSEDIYSEAHKNLPILCHDVFIKHQGGIILVKREREPAKGKWWPVGGRVLRGVSFEDSLKDKAKKECGLSLKNIELMGIVRHFFDDAYIQHEKGTDTPTLVYFADGEGEINLDKLHSAYRIIKKEDFYKNVRDYDHEVKDFMEKIISEGKI